MCVIELSKVPIYEFHYDYMKTKYGSKSRLLFTDTCNLTSQNIMMIQNHLLLINERRNWRK